MKDRKVIETKRDEYKQFFDECFNNAMPGPNGDRAMAILGGAFLDERLYHLLDNFIVEDLSSKELIDKVLDFSARIDFSYSLGLIGAGMKKDLHHVRKIRNSFAHDLQGRSFSDDDIKSHCAALQAYDLGVKMFDDPRSRFASTVTALASQIHLNALGTKRREPAKDFTLGEFIRVP